MYDVYFANYDFKDATHIRMCQVPYEEGNGFYAACAVWDALCLKFLVVRMYDPQGNLVREYNNLP